MKHEFFQYEQYAVIQSPEQKGPACTVPESGKPPYKHQISQGTPQALSIASQWNVHIIAKPASQSPMPAAPEVRDAGRCIGMIKVFLQTNTEHPSQSDCHIHIALKIKIDLKGVCKQAQPGAGHGYAVRACIGPKRCQCICQQQLLRKPHQKADGPFLQHGRLPGVFQLPSPYIIAFNRSHDQLRKKRQIDRNL